ncbi:hypothetical protein [Embleya sp. MST-111070]|uniref:hypothetical protein n=1 Tax=Embleya sp. MST-111070 TaxID=3398231 RepID=UPI003F74040F
MPPAAWYWSDVKLTAGDYNGDGKADVVAFYDYGAGHSAMFTFLAKPDNTGGFQDPLKSRDTPNGATTAFVFKARPDGGFDGGDAAWEAPPGTW